MSNETKRRISAIAHFVWALLAIVYFVVAVLLARSGRLQPESLKDTLSESIGYAVALVIFIVFYAVGVGIGVFEAIAHGIIRLTRPEPSSTHEIFTYIVLFFKAAVIADCSFLAYVMGDQLLPEARSEALFFILPLTLLALLQIPLFLIDLKIKKADSPSLSDPSLSQSTPTDQPI